MAKIALLSQYYGQVYRGSEVFAQELSSRLKAQVYPNSSHLKPGIQVVISTNGRADVFKAKLWCLLHRAKLIVSSQSGPGLDDRLNLYAFPDVFVALTSHQATWAKKINPFVKIIVIPNGVDLHQFNPQVKPIKINLPRPVILTVGARNPSKVGEISKRQELLIAAAKKISCSVLCVGRGGDLSLKHGEMPGIYTACDLFSYPTSSRESFGIAMLEAMASGLPVVATDDPIRREIVGNAGLFVDPVDTDAYSATLQKALSAKWGDKPRHQAEKFSWDIIAQKYDQLVSKLNR